MQDRQIPIRHYGGRILMAVALVVFIPVWASNAMAYTRVSGGAAFSFGNSDIDFLAGYGTWSSIQPYGQVWVPSVRAGWEPFEYGHWAWTSDNWTWVSYEPYGWMVYHYGHWDYDPEIGWFWIPGNVWSPAQVVWSDFDDYICWAPSPPLGVYWGRPWEPSRFGFNVWVGVRRGDFDRENISRFRVREFPEHVSRSRQEVFNGPPDRYVVERYVNHPIATQRIQRESAPWQGRHYDRMIPPRSQQRIVDRWQPRLEGKAYIPTRASSQNQSRAENRKSSGNERGNSQRGNSQQRDHGNGRGHSNRGRGH